MSAGGWVGVGMLDQAGRLAPLAGAPHWPGVAQCPPLSRPPRLPTPACSTPAGHTYTPEEQPYASPLMRQLFPRADAMDATSQYDLQGFVPQVGWAGEACGGVPQGTATGDSLLCSDGGLLPAADAAACAHPPAPQVVVVAGATNDFGTATLSATKKVLSPDIQPLAQWLQAFEDTIGAVSGRGAAAGGGAQVPLQGGLLPGALVEI